MKELVLREQKMGAMTVPAQTYKIEDVKNLIAPNATDSELIMFCTLAQANNLDPFKREIYFIKYGGNKPSYVTGYQVYLQRAAMSGQLNGWEVTVNESDGKAVSATITIYRKDMDKPVVWTVLREEFDKGQANWKSMPSFMIQKVAIGQGFRLAFPEFLAGMPYLAEEITVLSEDAAVNGAPVATPAPKAKSKAGTKRKVQPKDVTTEVKVEPKAEPPAEPPEDEGGENDEGEGEGDEGEGEPPAAEPPRPPDVQSAPPPKLMTAEQVDKMTKHFAKLGITGDTIAAVLEKPSDQWNESHRLYLQSAWYKLTDEDPTKKMSVEDFAKLRYGSEAPF